MTQIQELHTKCKIPRISCKIKHCIQNTTNTSEKPIFANIQPIYNYTIYSFSRLLTHYNWFIWPNFPNNSYSSQNKDMFLKNVNTFLLLSHTLQCAQCFLQNSTQTHGIVFHRFNHKHTIELTQAPKEELEQRAFIQVWTFSSKTDDTQVRISGWYEQEHKWLCVL